VRGDEFDKECGGGLEKGQERSEERAGEYSPTPSLVKSSGNLPVKKGCREKGRITQKNPKTRNPQRSARIKTPRVKAFLNRKNKKERNRNCSKRAKNGGEANRRGKVNLDAYRDSYGTMHMEVMLSPFESMGGTETPCTGEVYEGVVGRGGKKGRPWRTRAGEG